MPSYPCTNLDVKVDRAIFQSWLVAFHLASHLQTSSQNPDNVDPSEEPTQNHIDFDRHLSEAASAFSIAANSETADTNTAAHYQSFPHIPPGEDIFERGQPPDQVSPTIMPAVQRVR